MPHLSWNEVRDRAIRFSRDHAGTRSERADKQTFWNDFFDVFGVRRASVASFEVNVRNLQGNTGAIDLRWKGKLLVEHTSFGEDLSLAETQAITYIEDLTREDRWEEIPRYVLVSDFARFVLYDLEPEEQRDLPLFQGRQIETHRFTLAEFPHQVRHFAFMLGQTRVRLRVEDEANEKAYARMCQLHDELARGGFTGHALERLLVRLLFCLFAEDNGIFGAETFTAFIRAHTRPDGSDLGPQLSHLFQILDTPRERRQSTLEEDLAAFPYVNGKLFDERLDIPVFDRAMRESLLFCADFQWAAISPAVFGSLFQGIMEDRARRQQGAHYTSERDILKVIHSLFLDELRAEWDRARADRSTRRRAGLEGFQQKLRSLQFLDPACGCGNFLVLAYRELRILEIEVLKAIADELGGQQLLPTVDVDQFHGIEIAEWPVRIAEVALWLMDHQMNTLAAERFLIPYERLPLGATPHIVCDNALTKPWEEVLLPDKCSYVLGNPPFVGKQYRDARQQADMARVWDGVKGAGVLDFVTAWYRKAAAYIQGTRIPVAFVSTNSISQGEQVGILWGELFQRYHIKIHFAHRTFAWASESRGKAHVHVVIIGFGAFDRPDKRLFDYEAIAAEPTQSPALNISPYLVEGPDVAITKRTKPLCAVSEIAFGSMANDGGHLMLDEMDRAKLLDEEPTAARFLRPILGSVEFINGTSRWCLWLQGVAPHEWRALPPVKERVRKVCESREASPRATTRALATSASLFGEDRQPPSRYLAIPKTSSEVRRYIPMGFLLPETIANTELLTVANASDFEFGVLTSSMHMAWVRAICGRLKSDYRYSAGLVYNNFPWPTAATSEQRAAVEEAAREVLAAREPHLPPVGASTLADLYDPLAMPKDLAKAHARLDRAVERCYAAKPFESDRQRVEHLFVLYEKLTAPLLPATRKPGGRGKKLPPTVPVPPPVALPTGDAAPEAELSDEEPLDDGPAPPNPAEEALPSWYREALAAVAAGFMDDAMDRILDELSPMVAADRRAECDTFLARVAEAEPLNPIPVLIALLSTTRTVAESLPHRATVRIATHSRLAALGKDADAVLRNI